MQVGSACVRVARVRGGGVGNFTNLVRGVFCFVEIYFGLFCGIGVSFQDFCQHD